MVFANPRLCAQVGRPSGWCRASARHQPQPFSDFLKHLQRPIQFVARMRRSDDSPHARLAFGHRGNPIPVASTPSSNSSRESSVRELASPTITGVIGVSLSRVEARCLQSLLEVAGVVPEHSMRSGSCSSTSNAARHAAATAGGWEVENRNGRARWYRNSIRSRLPQT